MNLKKLFTGLGALLYSSTLLIGQNAHAECMDLSADYIIVGAGTAGCLMAEKLSRDHSVILIAGGQSVSDDELIEQGYGPTTAELNRYFMPSGHWREPRMDVPGHSHANFQTFFGTQVIGGGSSTNGMQYITGTAPMFDRLAAYLGDTDWNGANVFARFKALETFTNNTGLYANTDRGTTGPIRVRLGCINAKTAGAIAVAMNAVYPAVKLEADCNDFANTLTAMTYFNLSQDNNFHRCSSATAFLDPHVNKIDGDYWEGRKGKLRVFVNALGDRVIFDNCKTKPRAKGVLAHIGEKQYAFQAKKKVCLCMGIRSCIMLQWSGIGDADVLAAAGIPVVYNNPNVGRNMRDQPIFAVSGSFQQGGQVIPFSQNNNPADNYSGFYGPPLDAAYLTNPNEFILNERAFQMFGFGVTNTFAFMLALCFNNETNGYYLVNTADPMGMPNVYNPYWLSLHDQEIAWSGYNILRNTLTQMGWATFPNFATFTDFRDFIILNPFRDIHYTGMCRMAPSAADGVCDSSGHVFGVCDLVVADATIYPIDPTSGTMSAAYMAGEIVSNKLIGK